MFPLQPPLLWAVAVALAVAVAAAATDLRNRTVPNWLTVPAALCGLALNGLLPHGGGWLWALAGLAVGAGTLLPAVLLGWVGAGDMKLLAAFGAIGGWPLATGALAAGTLVGAAASLWLLFWYWRRQLVIRALGVALLSRAVPLRQALRHLGRPLHLELPFAAYLAAGAAIFLAGRWLGWW